LPREIFKDPGFKPTAKGIWGLGLRLLGIVLGDRKLRIGIGLKEKG